MEALSGTQQGPRGRRPRGGSRMLRLQSDEQLVEILRAGDEHAFEAIVGRYRARLFGFCRKMLGSSEDAEDVLQEVLANAYRAMLADRREINLRPWLFRIARNRCLNHLQRISAIPTEQEQLERVPAVEAAATHERAQNREEFRSLLDDLHTLPESQREALILREVDGLSYDQVGERMTTTVPAVRSLLTRARASLAEASQARNLTCVEIQLQIADAAGAGQSLSGPARRHMRECERCGQVGAEADVGATALAPFGFLVVFKDFLIGKLGGAAGAGAGAGAAAGGGGLLGGAASWASGGKVAAATVAVAVVGVGAGELSTGGDPGPGQRIAPAVSAPEPAPAPSPGVDAGETQPFDPVGPTEPRPFDPQIDPEPSPPAAETDPVIEPEEIPPLDGPVAPAVPGPDTPEAAAGCNPHSDPATASDC